FEVWGAMRTCFLTWGMGASPAWRLACGVASMVQYLFGTWTPRALTMVFSARPARDRLVYSVECWEQPTYRISTTA
ncbi:hypothetical protein F5148DRAFT_1156204, partial [Russula earlei]